MANILKQITRTIKYWWLYLIYGILLIAFSIWIWLTPLESYVGLAIAFSVLILINGISNIYFSISNRNELEGWGWYLAHGIFELVIGGVLIFYPSLSIASMPFIIGFWLMFKSIFLTGIAFDLKSYGLLDWGWFFAIGLCLAFLSFSIILHPIMGAFTIVGWTGAAIMLFGISCLVLAFKLRKLKKKSLDKIDELKARIKQEIDEFRKNALLSMDSGSEEVQSKILEIEYRFDDFKNRVIKALDVQ